MYPPDALECPGSADERKGRVIEMERDRRPVSDPASRAGHEQAHQTAVRLPGVAGWMQLVLSKVTDGVIATDAECRITGLNATAQHVTGWTSEEATGRRLHDILRVSAASLTHGALTDDQHLTLPDATVLVGREREHPISGSVSAVLDDNGELAGLILLFRETMPGGGREVVSRQVVEICAHHA